MQLPTVGPLSIIGVYAQSHICLIVYIQPFVDMYVKCYIHIYEYIHIYIYMNIYIYIYIIHVNIYIYIYTHE